MLALLVRGRMFSAHLVEPTEGNSWETFHTSKGGEVVDVSIDLESACMRGYSSSINGVRRKD